jgi:hypothetical protein
MRTGPPTDWYHVRAWVKVTGKLPSSDGVPPEEPNWATDATWLGPGGFRQNLAGALAIFMPKEPGYVGNGALPGPYGPNGELLSYRPAIRVDIDGLNVVLRYPGAGVTISMTDVFPYSGSGGYLWPVGDWVCLEVAVGNVNAAAGTGSVKFWVQGKLKWDSDFGPPNYGLPGVGPPVGFAFGSMSEYGGLGTPSFVWPFLGTLQYHAPFQERYEDRRWGLSASWARIAEADGPIGCHTRGGVPPDEIPDPDAMRCTSADAYAGADVIAGECGRIICSTQGKTRESWETVGAGFPAAKSFWYSWTAPRNGNFIFRTRGSEVFNELSVHRHTGATPPPLVASSDSDDWDPTASTSAAVEFLAEAGVEYRIRVASGLDGWIVLDFGPPKHLVQDDGWSIDSSRDTRERVFVVGPESGVAVEDDQVAASPTGAGTQPTMQPIVFGDSLS